MKLGILSKRWKIGYLNVSKETSNSSAILDKISMLGLLSPLSY